MTTRILASTVLALLFACGDGGSDATTGESGAGETTAAVDETGTISMTGGVTTGGEQPTSGGSTGSGSTGSGSTGAGEDSGTGTDDSGTTAEALPRPRVLVYRGNGGESPSGDYFRFDLLSERLSAAGKMVSDTEVWPASLDDVGLVILVVNAEPFDATQVADLEGVLAAGGVVLVSNEWSTYAESENLNALLAGLGSALGFVDDLAADAGGGTVVIDGVTVHPLMQGVTSMVVAASSAVTGCADGRALLEVGDVCLLAAEAHGPGLLLAFGDTDVLDDHVLSVAAADQNFAFLANLMAKLP